MIAQYCDVLNPAGVRCRRQPRHSGHHRFTRDAEPEVPELEAYPHLKEELTRAEAQLRAEGLPSSPVPSQPVAKPKPKPEVEIEAITRMLDILVGLMPRSRVRVMRLVGSYLDDLETEDEERARPAHGPSRTDDDDGAPTNGEGLPS